MNDLISRKTVDNSICKLIEKLEAEGLSMSYDMDEIIELQMEIEGIPTAYDADKVVEQISEYLNGFKECSDYDEELSMYMEEYITKLVKGGGKDE